MNDLGLRVTTRIANNNKIIFLKTKDKLVIIASTDLDISDEGIIEIYKQK